MPFWAGSSIKKRDPGLRIVEDGRITFRTDLDGIARANIFLRTAERILLKIGSFKAYTFDDLFEGTKKLPWEDYIPENGRFWERRHQQRRVNCLAHRISSQLSRRLWLIV